MKWERSPSHLWDWVSYGPPILYVRKILDEWECRGNSREGKSAIGKTRDEAAKTYLKAANAGNERKMK